MSWLQVRRYAVPRWMIERATERRLAGDWRGACAAANIDVTFDLDDVARTYGAATATSLERDLRGFAPDLARWHLPRWFATDGVTTLSPVTVLLADHGTAAVAEPSRSEPAELVAARAVGSDGDAPPLHRGGRGVPSPTTRASVNPPEEATRRGLAESWASRPSLELTVPESPYGMQGPTAQQRMRLSFGPLAAHLYRPRPRRPGPQTIENWRRLRHLWHADHSHELLHRCGGGIRPPFLDADGRPLDDDRLPPPSPDYAELLGPEHPAEYAECVTRIQERGEVMAALAAVGIKIGAEDVPRLRDSWLIALTRLVPEAQEHLAGTGSAQVRFGGYFLTRRKDQWVLECDLPYDTEPSVPVPRLPEACWRRLPDLDLLRSGHLRPDELHPLVYAALFPRGEAEAAGPPQPEPPALLRVRCQGEWHMVRSRAGRLDIPHDDTELRREQALHALGGRMSGCLVVRQAWTTGQGWLPKGLRAQRRDVFLRAQHGDTPGVVRLLEAGLDPHVRDGAQRNLLHWLPCLDHEALLPRLLAAGLDPDAHDRHGRTPLTMAHVAAPDGALVQALRAAGASDDGNLVCLPSGRLVPGT